MNSQPPEITPLTTELLNFSTAQFRVAPVRVPGIRYADTNSKQGAA